MNERIKQLAIEAKIRPALLLQMFGKIDALCDSELEELANVEKFAELIVKECIDTMGSEIVYNANYIERNKAISDMMVTVKNHFGIE